MKPTTIDELEDRLSQPTEESIESLREMDGDFLLLGVGGKMGPSLARMVRRIQTLLGRGDRVFGAARFSDPAVASYLEAHGIETLPCNLLDDDALAKLPTVPNVVFMTGMKFGSSGNRSMTWGMNTLLPGRACQRFSSSRIVAFSTGNVYGWTSTESGGSRETDELEPVGEYAMSCVGRERILEYASLHHQIPMSIIRLNYACDLRYGVLVDIATKVLQGTPIDLAMSYFNTIWQGDANALTLASMKHLQSAPYVVNVTGPDILRVKEVAEHFAKRFGRDVQLVGEESETALLSNTAKSLSDLGSPRVGATELIDWVADWILAGGKLLGKPTHFESREGRF